MITVYFGYSLYAAAAAAVITGIALGTARAFGIDMQYIDYILHVKKSVRSNFSEADYIVCCEMCDEYVSKLRRERQWKKAQQLYLLRKKGQWKELFEQLLSL